MARSLLKPWHKRSWLASAAYTTTTTSAALSLPIADSYQIFIDCTAASGTTPLCDIVLQTSFDGGTNYVDLPIRSSQFTTTRQEVFVFRLGLGSNEVALGNVVADTGGILAKNCLFDPSFLKIKLTVAGTTPSFTVRFDASALPKDSIN